MRDIQNYNLFGESADLPDVVHCETIEARSVIHDWEFGPHRHARLHQFLVIESGGGTGSFEETTRRLGSDVVVNVPAGVVHAFSFQRGTHGWVVTLAREVLDEYLQECEGLEQCLALPEAVNSSARIRSVVLSMFAEFRARAFARAHVLRALSGHLAGLVARAIAEAGNPEARSEHPLRRRFESLVETHFREHLGVADYAARLAVTPTHLSRVMRQTTGRSASAAIEDRIIREARRYLAYSNLSVSEVAYQLGFSDPAYFSRVFSRSSGLSPRAFRRRIELPATG